MKVPLKKTQKVKIRFSGDIYPIMREILLRETKSRRKQEFFWVVALDTANRIVNIELVALGAVNVVAVTPMDIFSIPLQKRCKNIILVHNHPSGAIKPSEADITLTKRIKAAAEILLVSVHDHLIITPESYYSFTDAGVLKTL